MTFKQFKEIMGLIGIPERKCKHDTDKGLFVAYLGEYRLTGNGYSKRITRRNLRTGEMVVSEALV